MFRKINAVVVFLITLLVVASFAGCSGKKRSGNDPQQRLTDYIAASFKVEESKDRQKMISFLTGGAKNRLLAWSDEQFREVFVENKRQFVKLAIREMKDVSDTETNVTYELTYLDPGKGTEARVTNKRMAEMVLEDGQWYIREVHNIKELIEYKNEMTF